MPLLVLGGLVLRLLFLWVGADIYYQGRSPYVNNDSYSFTQSFYNLVEHGIYTFNPKNPEAAFGRLPGYPFFWGAHWLLFDEQYVNQAVAYTQALLDTAAIYLVYATARAFTRDIRAAWMAGLLYAGYPFIIVWLTMTGSEALGTFLTIVLFWWLATRPVTKATAVGAGLLIGVAFMVREYLGILLLGTVFWVYLAKGEAGSLFG
ncbi:glycosyltransferase family 39 protein [Hymenobacter cellulosivorans]|uniref:Glycosyltransferase family 39 protein n=1 Tax=Hymenobacter cellulosivorans TaxID=2932249 RepID=A0ABY4FGN7_9BACT|nr:glycosyltransferase family 39 protein [Hymenobacter cellulosivorans]UOQ55182.1 glycosyltransferase family 39 protein [Hymenobacter cellulosivorans]